MIRLCTHMLHATGSSTLPQGALSDAPVDYQQGIATLTHKTLLPGCKLAMQWQLMQV